MRRTLGAAWATTLLIGTFATGTAGVGTSPLGAGVPASRAPSPAPQQSTPTPPTSLTTDLETLFNDPILARALLAVRVESLADGRLLYTRNSDKLVVPGSNMKLLTMAATAATLGWDFTYETRLEAVGAISKGVLRGDLVVVGSGDPTMGSHDAETASFLLDWADAVRAAGIRRIEGRVVGDDDAFDDAQLGAGWAWDYLADGYAAPASALSYNENVAVLRVTPAATQGLAPGTELGPPGHELRWTSDVVTGAPKSATSLSFARLPGSTALSMHGSVPAGGVTAVRTVAVDNPTRYFANALVAALEARGVVVAGGAWDIDDLKKPPAGERHTVAVYRSPSMAVMAGNFLKPSQNFYGEMFLKTLARHAPVSAAPAGTSDNGKQVVKNVLTSWGVPADSYVMYDGSGLSRYNYVTADTIVAILKHVWQDDALRGPFVAALPVAGRDGTLDTRMKGTVLEANVRAKTGTISNMRSLSGFVTTATGETLVFSMIGNHFTVPNAQLDAVVERALVRLVNAK